MFTNSKVQQYDLFHLPRVFLHLREQPELTPCTLKVMFLVMDFIIAIPVDMIGEEPQADDIGHKSGGES